MGILRNNAYIKSLKIVSKENEGTAISFRIPKLGGDA